ncbi:hypothetical protein Tco_0880322, partial [Tanacetum coccineum]
MFSPYRGPNHGLLSNLSKSPREIIAIEKAARSFEQPPRTFGNRQSQDMSKYCHFHEDYGHDTNDCHQLRNHIEEAVKSGQLTHLVKGIKKERVKASKNQRTEGKKDKSTTPAEAPILMIRQDELYTKNKFEDLTSKRKEITFLSGGSNSSAPVVIKAKLIRKEVNRVHMDSGSSCEVIYEHCFMKLKPSIRASKVDSKVPLIRFLGEKSWSIMKIPLTAMQKMEIVVSTIYEAIKFHTTRGIDTVFLTHESDKVREGMQKVREIPLASEKGVFSCTTAKEKVVVNNKYPEQTVAIGKQLPKHFKGRLRDLLRANAYVFALTHDDM